MLATLLKMRFASLFAAATTPKKRRRSLIMTLLLLLLFAYVAVALVGFFVLIFATLGGGLAEAGGDHLYFALGGTASLLLMVVGSVAFTQNQLYVANDNELLLSMPIPERLILISRLLLLLAVNYILEALIALPMMVVWLFVGRVTLLGILSALLVLLALPPLALALSCLFGWVLARLVAKFKRKTFLTLFLSLLLIGAYFVLCFGLGYFAEDIETLDFASVAATLNAIAPLRLLGRAMVGAPLALLAVLALSVGVSALVFLWLVRTFRTTVLARPAVARAVYREEKKRASRSPLVALTVRELSHLASSAGYMMNAGLGLVMALVPPILLLVNRSSLAPLFEEAPFLLPLLAPAAVVVTTLCLSTVLFSACTVSLEGRSLWVVRTSPVPTRTVLLSKALYHLVPTLPTAVVALILYAVALSLPVLDVLAALLGLLAYLSLASLFGLLMNLLFPKLEWKNELVPVKQGGAVLLSMLGAGAAAGLGALLLIPLSFLLPAAVALLIYAAVLGAVAFLLYKLVMSVGVRRFEAL